MGTTTTQLSFFGTQLPLGDVLDAAGDESFADTIAAWTRAGHDLAGQIEVESPMAEGRRRRDAGMARAGLSSGIVSLTWAQFADRRLAQLARRHPFLHTDLVAPAVEAEWTPTSPNQWGAVWRRAVRRGLVERTGEWRPSAQPGKHHHQYPLYRSLVYGQAAAETQESEAA